MDNETATKKRFSLDEFVMAWNDHGGNAEAVCNQLHCHRATFFRKQNEAISAGLLPVNARAKNSASPASISDGNTATVTAQAVDLSVPDSIDDGQGGKFFTGDYIPSLAEFAEYIPRTGIIKQVEHVIGEHKNGHQSGVPFLIGEAGTGKSSLFRYISAIKKLPFLQLACDGLLEFGDLYGAQALVNGSTKFIEGTLIKLACNVPTVILLDEATFIDPSKFSRLLTFIEDRQFFVKEARNGQGEVYRLHPETIVCLAGNPPSATYTGTGKVNLALVNRATVVTVPTWTAGELRKIFKGKPIIDRLLAFFNDCKTTIEQQNLRTTFSIRDLSKILYFLEGGFPVGQALNCGFLNGVALTAGIDKAKAFEKFAELNIGDLKKTASEIEAGGK